MKEEIVEAGAAMDHTDTDAKDEASEQVDNANGSNAGAAAIQEEIASNPADHDSTDSTAATEEEEICTPAVAACEESALSENPRFIRSMVNHLVTTFVFDGCTDDVTTDTDNQEVNEKEEDGNKNVTEQETIRASLTEAERGEGGSTTNTTESIRADDNEDETGEQTDTDHKDERHKSSHSEQLDTLAKTDDNSRDEQDNAKVDEIADGADNAGTEASTFSSMVCHRITVLDNVDACEEAIEVVESDEEIEVIDMQNNSADEVRIESKDKEEKDAEEEIEVIEMKNAADAPTKQETNQTVENLQICRADDVDGSDDDREKVDHKKMDDAVKEVIDEPVVEGSTKDVDQGRIETEPSRAQDEAVIDENDYANDGTKAAETIHPKEFDLEKSEEANTDLGQIIPGETAQGDHDQESKENFPSSEITGGESDVTNNARDEVIDINPKNDDVTKAAEDKAVHNRLTDDDVVDGKANSSSDVTNDVTEGGENRVVESSRLVIAVDCPNNITNIRSCGSSTSISVCGQEQEQLSASAAVAAATAGATALTPDSDQTLVSGQQHEQVSLGYTESKYISSIDISSTEDNQTVQSKPDKQIECEASKENISETMESSVEMKTSTDSTEADSKLPTVTKAENSNTTDTNDESKNKIETNAEEKKEAKELEEVSEETAKEVSENGQTKKSDANGHINDISDNNNKLSAEEASNKNNMNNHKVNTQESNKQEAADGKQDEEKRGKLEIKQNVFSLIFGCFGCKRNNINKTREDVKQTV